MKYSTGRETKVKYSTAMSWDEYEKKIRRSRVRYSTGKGSALRHSCGALMDDESAEQENRPDQHSASVEEKKDLKGKRGKGFRTIVAEY